MTPRTYLLTKDGDGMMHVLLDDSVYWVEDDQYWEPSGRFIELKSLHESWADALEPHFRDMPNGAVKAVTLDGALADHLDRVMT